MKKLFTLLTMLVLGIGSFAQTHHSTETGTNTLNATTIMNKAKEGDLYVSIQNHTTTANYYINYEGKGTNSFSDEGNTTWKVVPHDGGYALQRIKDGKYIYEAQRPVTFTNNIEDALLFMPTDCEAGVAYIASGYNSNKAVRWKLKDNTRLQMNTNGMNTSTTVQFNDGTGNWTCLFTYEVTFKYQVTFSCKVGETLIYTESALANAGDVLDVPNLPGYTAPSPSEYTVGSEDANHEIIYTPSLYPVNFTSGQTFTRSDRHINSVTFDIDGEDQTVNGLYNNTSTKCYQDLTDSKTVTLPVNTSVKPKFSVTGGWQHGFVYIDLNNDGDFIDDGELVSKKIDINNSPNLSTDMPSFPTPSTPGTYRMRIKTDWASEDPGGNTGVDPHEITSNNHIIKNGGMIVDVTLNLFEPHVQYIVKDGSDNVLFTSEPVATTNGAHITTLPEEYQKTDFYEYNTLDITISKENTTATFTATIKDTPLVKFTSDTTNPVWYRMKLKNAYYPTYVNSTPNVTTPTTNADDETVQWAFIGNPYEGFHIICRAAKDGSDNYLVLGSASTTGSTNTGGDTYATFAAKGTQNNELWDIRPSDFLTGGFFIFNKEGHALNERSTANLAYWTKGNGIGSTFTATEVLEGEALFNALIEELETYPYGTGVNHYHCSDGTYSYYAEVLEMISGLKATGYSESTLSQVQALKDGTSINQPTPGYYRIQNKYTSRYVNCTNVNNTEAKTSADTDGDNNSKTIFYIDSEKDIQAYDNGAYWKGVYRMGRGSFIDGSKTYAYKHPWQFVEGNSLGTYKLIYGNDTEGKYHATGVDDVTGYANLNSEDANADKATWYLIPVSELPARTEAGNSERGNEITFAPAETEVNENVPNVLVETSTPGTYTCNNLQLTDDVIAQFTTKTNFTNTKVTYSRAATASQWGTIYLPYDPEVEEGVTYYELTATEENYLKFTKVDNPEANTPYMYKKTTADDMSVTNTSTSATFALGGDTSPHEGSGVNNYHLVGILTNSSIVENDEIAAKAGYNKIIDPNAYYFKNTDNTFRPLPTSNIFSMKAFRCYLTSSTNARQNVLGFIYEDNGQPTGVSIIESEDGNTVDVIFDLNGRRLQNAKKGINIINGKKVIK